MSAHDASWGLAADGTESGMDAGMAWHGDYGSQDMYGYEQEAMYENWSSVMPGYHGAFDATGTWVPYTQTESDGGFYDITGAWVPSVARDTLQSSKDQRAEFEARAKAVLAKKRLQEAMEKVAPARDEQASVEVAVDANDLGISQLTDLCWDFQQTGTCARGLACQWRHSLQETAEAASMRRSQVLSTLRAGRPGTGSPWSTNHWATNQWPTRSRGTGAAKAWVAPAPIAPPKPSEVDPALRPSRRPPTQVAVQRPTKEQLLKRLDDARPSDERTPERVKDRAADSIFSSPEKCPAAQAAHPRRVDAPSIDISSPSNGERKEDFTPLVSPSEVHSTLFAAEIVEVPKEQVVPTGGASGIWQRPRSNLPFSYADIVKTPPGFKTVQAPG